MIRLALILCHLIAAVCGPRPCCCATAAPVPQSVPIVPPKPTPPKCPLCAADAGKRPEPKPDKPEPNRKHDCPCQKARSLPPPYLAPPSGAGDDVRLAGDGMPVGHLTSSAASVGPNHAATFAVFTALSAAGSHHFLLLPHRLRC